MKLPNYKDIIDLIKKGATLEAQEKVMALREGALELQEENINLQEEIKKLQEKLEIKEKIYFEDGLYWLISNETNNPNDPFCPRCFDVEGKLVHIHRAHGIKILDKGPFTSGFVCRQCSSKYEYLK